MVMDQEKDLNPDVQIAARMLWAAVDSPHNYKQFLTILERDFPNVLRRLDPLTIQYFVHLAAGLPTNIPSAIVFVWDEANTVPPSPNPEIATFFQDQLSAVVDSRVSALDAIRRDSSNIDVLLVPVAASTRGSAMSLLQTSSKKAVYADLRLPLIQGVDGLTLIAMDLLRRLPLPLPIRQSVLGTLNQEGKLSSLPLEVGGVTSFISNGR